MDILKKTEGIGFKLRMNELLETFSETAKASQLFIKQPSVAVMLYAQTDKPGSYCGFYKPLRPGRAFDCRSFLW